MKKQALLTLLFASFAQITFAQAVPDQYLGLTPPGTTPEIFAPGVVSVSSRTDHTVAISPSGHEIFFGAGDWPTRITQYVQYKDGAWTAPDTATFSAAQSVDEVIFSPNGNRVYFYAYLPGSSANAELYYSEKVGDAWGAPVIMGTPPNSTSDEWHPCVVSDGSIYFINGSGKVCRSQYSNGSYQAKVLLSTVINDASNSYRDPYVAPDESYIIFTSYKAGGFGNADLYISFKKADGTWTTAQNFGNTINTTVDENSADITPDGKYMTFDRNGDIYWVRIDNTIANLKANSGITAAEETDFSSADINIFPNPSNGQFCISLEGTPGISAKVEICSIIGNVIFSKSITSSTAINLPNAPKGIYLARVTKGNQTAVRKFCIQ